MKKACDPTPYLWLHFSIHRYRNGYLLSTTHTHEGSPHNPCGPEDYERLSWNELQDLMEVLSEERRPGTHPHGWEQLRLYE
jgi:hypothetical protein